MGFNGSLTRQRRVTPILLGVVLLALGLFHFWLALGPRGLPSDSPGVESILDESRDLVEEGRAFLKAFDDNQRRLEEARGDERATARLIEDMKRQNEETRRQVEGRRRVRVEREARRQAGDLRRRWWTGALGGLCLLLAAKFLADGLSSDRRGADVEKRAPSREQPA